MDSQSSFFILFMLLPAVLLQACSPAATPTQEADGAPDAAPAVSFVENVSEPFNTYDGIAFVRHTGFFEGETSLGAFRMPYEIIAPEDPAQGNGAVLVEPPHFLGGPFGRDRILFRDFVFETVSGYATVGFGDNGRNVLDPSASDLLLAGEPVEEVGAINFSGILDEEIFIQFTRALTTAPFVVDILGDVERLYGYGISQTAALLLESQRNVAHSSQQPLFDFTLLHTVLWRVPFDTRRSFDFLSGDFEPLENVVKVIMVQSEGDLIMSDAEQFRRAVDEPNYRVYEVAGAAHAPSDLNPLDHHDVAQAMFAAGDRWVRSGTAPPPSVLLASAPEGQVDPVYDEETGIARNGDLNARGGVRLPNLEVGRAQYVAADETTPVPRLPRMFNILTGSSVDLACRPAADANSEETRFSSHEAYVSAFNRQVDELQQQGFLLEREGEEMKAAAADTEVGKPGICE